MESELSDADLLAAHVAGDDDAFSTLFARHRDRLWAVALRTCNDPETAADGLQEGLIAAFRRAGSYRGEAAVTTWLHRIVVNACLDRLRAAKVRRAEALPDDLEEYAGRGSTVSADGAEDPADLSVRHDRRARVLAALNGIAPGLVGDLMKAANGLLPEPAGARGEDRRTGWQSFSSASPSIWTRLADGAAGRNNQLRSRPRTCP